jgi:hypothetical protein
MSLETLTVFFGWLCAINFGLLLVTTVMLFLLQDFAAEVHGKMFKMDKEDLKKAYFQYLAQFKIVVIVFNLAPYLALTLMGPTG